MLLNIFNQIPYFSVMTFKYLTVIASKLSVVSFISLSHLYILSGLHQFPPQKSQFPPCQNPHFSFMKYIRVAPNNPDQNNNQSDCCWRKSEWCSLSVRSSYAGTYFCRIRAFNDGCFETTWKIYWLRKFLIFSTCSSEIIHTLIQFSVQG